MENDKSIAFTIPFGVFCQLLEKLSNLDSRKQKAEKLRKFCDRFRRVYQNKYKTMDPSKANGDSLFCIIRILLPLEDKSRPPFGFKAWKLAHQFPKILGLDPDSDEGQNFLKFKDPKNVGPLIAGDLSKIIYDYLSTRTSHVSGNALNIGELHEILDSIAVLFAAGAAANENTNLTVPDRQRMILQNLFRRVSALEGKWLVRILLRRLDLGMVASSIFECVLHQDAQELYNRIGDLEAVCIDLNDPKAELKEDGIELFRPFQHMLCARLTNVRDPNDTIGCFNRKGLNNIPQTPFLIEIKWDGERFQIHYDSSRPPDDQFRYFSRSRREYSVAYLNLLTPKIRLQIHPRCRSFIMDGEMMVWSSLSKSFIQKAMSPELRRTAADHPELQPVFVAFDLIYFNGENLESAPLQQRMELLMNKRLVFQPQEGVIILSEQQLVHDNAKEAVTRALNRAIDNCEEGLVIKEYQSNYEIGKRGGSWLKLKPEYLSETSVSDLDLLILGGYFTKSQLKGGVVNSFLVGLLDEDPSNRHSAKEQFYSITTVGPGHLKNPQLWQLVKELEPHFIPKEKNPNFNIRFDSRPRPDFYIDPKKSIVLQVKASQIIVGESPKYSLNFPRITCVRRDKCWHEIMTLCEFTDLLAATSGRLVKRTDDFSSFSSRLTTSIESLQKSTPSKPNLSNYNRGGWSKPKNTAEVNPVPQSSPPPAISKSISSNIFVVPASSYKSKFSKKPTVTSSTASSSKEATKRLTTKYGGKVLKRTLDNRAFLVVGSMDFKNSVTTEIVENGGQIVQNPTNDLFAIIAEKISLRVNQFLHKATYPVLKYSWLQKCIQAGTVEAFLYEDRWVEAMEVTDQPE